MLTEIYLSKPDLKRFMRFSKSEIVDFTSAEFKRLNLYDLVGLANRENVTKDHVEAKLTLTGRAYLFYQEEKQKHFIRDEVRFWLPMAISIAAFIISTLSYLTSIGWITP